jgi:hypothetical protein
MTDRSYVERNRAGRESLKKLLAGLTPADLLLETEPGGWTVGQALGHLGFWDRFMATRWRAALAKGPEARPADMPNDVADLLNEALAPIWQAMTAQAPQALIAETLAAAEDIDGVVAALPPGAPVAEILATYPRQLERSSHRQDHLAAVERVLATRKG